MKQAGKLKNLNDLVVGAAVLNADSSYGYVTNISDTVTSFIPPHDGDIVQCRATIVLPQKGSTYHSYRHDGRSREDANNDIVRIVTPDNFKVKSVKVWSNRPISQNELSKANKAAEMAKVAAELGSKKLNGNIWTIEDIEVKVTLTKTFTLSIKVI